MVDTALGQLDSIVDIGCDAAIHGEPLDLVDVIAAVDRVTIRLGAALAGVGLREHA